MIPLSLEMEVLQFGRFHLLAIGLIFLLLQLARAHGVLCVLYEQQPKLTRLALAEFAGPFFHCSSGCFALCASEPRLSQEGFLQSLFRSRRPVPGIRVRPPV